MNPGDNRRIILSDRNKDDLIAAIKSCKDIGLEDYNTSLYVVQALKENNIDLSYIRNILEKDLREDVSDELAYTMHIPKNCGKTTSETPRVQNNERQQHFNTDKQLAQFVIAVCHMLNMSVNSVRDELNKDIGVQFIDSFNKSS